MSTADKTEEYARRLDQAVGRVAGWLRRLLDPDQVVELRALRVTDGARGGSTWAGTFRGAEVEDLARAALQLSGHCQGVYYTLHPLRPDRYRPQLPRVKKAAGGELAHDEHVLHRRWVLVDVDPKRAAGFEKASTTDGEKAAAWDTLQAVREYMTAEGWPAPVVSDSGNGYHLLYRLTEPLGALALPVPADDPVRRLLLHLADRFDSDRAEIDKKVFNPGRIVKLPGTLACKGDPTPDRPHRRAKILEVPE